MPQISVFHKETATAASHPTVKLIFQKLEQAKAVKRERPQEIMAGCESGGEQKSAKSEQPNTWGDILTETLAAFPLGIRVVI